MSFFKFCRVSTLIVRKDMATVSTAIVFVQTADVWSCGVTLYVMLVGAYPFEDVHDPRNFRKTINVREF